MLALVSVLLATSQVDIKYGQVKTLYHECLPAQCSDVENRNTADEAGDTGFVIESVGNTHNPNPEMNPPDTYVSQHIVQVDNRFSGYQCCNHLKCVCCSQEGGGPPNKCDDKAVGWQYFKKKATYLKHTAHGSEPHPHGSFAPVAKYLKQFGLWHSDLDGLNTTACPDWEKQVTTGQSVASWVSTTTAAKTNKMYHHVKHIKSIKTGCMIDVMIKHVDTISKKDCIGSSKQKIPSGGIYNTALASCFKSLWCTIPMDSVTESWAMALGTLAGTLLAVCHTSMFNDQLHPLSYRHDRVCRVH
jgi:hypothetical protein